ncbi:hypothetical protein PtrM4_085290 [Pyrenophora tritici-repentis]|uniref:HTH CENPB-type domain-containing protein n=1 Tax=Pyrenophora tritici-repentis TaxID=45151 RepID=A0A834VT34_9PLEO|nr:hypothetical protein PtrM4_085290 [Pyrenophora tritici-repentis]KAI1516099.1 hypothetical protein Ptr86124_004636 [Pyrenophora tritici-repentis]
MPQQRHANTTNQEGKIDLALLKYKNNEFSSLRRAAKAFKIPKSTLIDRYNGICSKPDLRNPRHNLTLTEEQTLVQYILNLNSRGFAPQLCEVEDMVNKLMSARGRKPVGKKWTTRFVTRSDKIKISFNRPKDRQRVLQEDPEVISACFKLVEETIAKYGILDKDIHNFNETGFQIGVIGSMKVVTGSKRRTRPDLIQPGDREWVTVIQSISLYSADTYLRTFHVILD